MEPEKSKEVEKTQLPAERKNTKRFRVKKTAGPERQGGNPKTEEGIRIQEKREFTGGEDQASQGVSGEQGKKRVTQRLYYT